MISLRAHVGYDKAGKLITDALDGSNIGRFGDAVLVFLHPIENVLKRFLGSVRASSTVAPFVKQFSRSGNVTLITPPSFRSCSRTGGSIILWVLPFVHHVFTSHSIDNSMHNFRSETGAGGYPPCFYLSPIDLRIDCFVFLLGAVGISKGLCPSFLATRCPDDPFDSIIHPWARMSFFNSSRE